MKSKFLHLLNDKLVKLVNLVMQSLKATKRQSDTTIFAESVKVSKFHETFAKSLKSLMSIFSSRGVKDVRLSLGQYPTNIQRISNLYLTPNRFFTRFAAVFALVFVMGVGNVWGADATMGGGTACTINGKTAKRAGTSSAAGSMTITVPNGATVLSFYCAAWSGESPTVSVTPAAKVGTSSFSPSADTGISNNSPFTLSGTESSYHRTIMLNSITSETTLTFANTAKKKRFVVWGAKVCFNPTSLTNGTITSNSARVSWTDSHNVGHYDVYCSTSSSKPAANATPTKANVTNKYADLTGLNAGTKYYWWVRAFDGECKTDWIAGTSFTTTAAAYSVSWSITEGGGSLSTTSGTSTTVTPTSGWRYASPAFTVLTGAASVAQSTNTFTATPTQNSTIRINMEEIPSHNIVFNTGGLVSIPSVTVREDSEYTITQTPAASLTPSCEYGTFVGWTNSSSIANPSVKPALVSSVTMSTSDVTLYAVYSKTVPGVGMMEDIASVTISDYATAHSWAGNGSPQVGEIPLNGDITATTNTDGNNGKYYSDWRLYQTNSGVLTVSAAEECVLKSVTFTYSTSNSGTLKDGNTTVASGSAYSISGTSKSFSVGNTGSATNGQVRVTAISVTYDKPSAGTTTYSLNPNCCESLAQINGSINLSHF